MQTILVFDIGDNRLRKKVEDDCMDAGMLRIQFSTFMGDLDECRRAELAGLIKNRADAAKKTEKRKFVVHILPLCAADFEKARTLRHGTGWRPVQPVIKAPFMLL